ncbi:ABC transporter permease [Atopobacter sp. AH10]|uniref:methionine ABC transporter permease n=1 Tax=Atopobacter sp. AH10 TaxID=2315861 RepID=UPI000EF1CE60|nr:methionine ABC transporter permease [Atopobacter sp. AH10]RLK62635.1 ABC transporter permease [Atopobacter sp. AH10]
MHSFLETYFPNVMEIPDEFIQATWDTIYMTLMTSILSFAIGILVGVILLVTRKDGILACPTFYSILDKFINISRAIPFIIMLAILAKVTKLIVGMTIGATAALVPMVATVVPFFARQIENALLEVDPGVIEAAQAMGLRPIEIIFRVYLKEGLAGIIRAAALTIINVIGLTAMAGAVGAGGLGDLAITRGHNRFQGDVTFVATILILVLVFASQAVSNFLIKRLRH